MAGFSRRLSERGLTRPRPPLSVVPNEQRNVRKNPLRRFEVRPQYHLDRRGRRALRARELDPLGQRLSQVRDYLCANRESLKAYTETLDQKWRAIVDEGNKLQSEEKKLYEEMLATTKRIIDELTQADRTMKEKIGYAGTFPLLAVEKLGGMAADLAGLPDGAGEAAEKAAEYAREKLQDWIESNQTLQGRAANYRALVQAEKGGVLPLFKETRQQVYEYWDRNNLDRARDWVQRFRTSLENEWVTACPTYGLRCWKRNTFPGVLRGAVSAWAKLFLHT